MAASLDERINILKLIEENKISAQQGLQLLQALDQDTPAETQTPAVEPEKPSEETSMVENKSKMRLLRVRVTDTKSGRAKVTVNLPFSLVRWGLRVGGQYSPEIAGLPLDELEEILRSTPDGKIVEVQDEEDGEHVEIYVE